MQLVSINNQYWILVSGMALIWPLVHKIKRGFGFTRYFNIEFHIRHYFTYNGKQYYNTIRFHWKMITLSLQSGTVESGWETTKPIIPMKLLDVRALWADVVTLPRCYRLTKSIPWFWNYYSSSLYENDLQKFADCG